MVNGRRFIYGEVSREPRGLPIYPEGTWKTVRARFCLMRYYSKGYPQGLQGSPTDVTTSCISCVHASPNPQVYALNDRSRGLKTPKHVSSQKKFAKIWRSHQALESALIPLVMLLTCKQYPNREMAKKRYREHRICEENIPRAQNSNDCIIQREMFIGLFEGATSK